MTKKERTIKACRELAAKYREPEGKVFFDFGKCSLCVISGRSARDNGDCLGCPMASSGKTTEWGCVDFTSYEEAVCADRYNEKNSAFEARAAFFDKIIPILEGLPASRFTKRGWKYFEMLDRAW